MCLQVRVLSNNDYFIITYGILLFDKSVNIEETFSIYLYGCPLLYTAIPISIYSFFATVVVIDVWRP